MGFRVLFLKGTELAFSLAFPFSYFLSVWNMDRGLELLQLFCCCKATSMKTKAFTLGVVEEDDGRSLRDLNSLIELSHFLDCSLLSSLP